MLHNPYRIAYHSGMDARYSAKQAEPITEEQLTAFLEEMKRIEGSIEGALVYLRDAKTLASYNFRSGYGGLTRLASFANALSNAVFLARNGKPLKAGQLKERSTANKKKKPKS